MAGYEHPKRRHDIFAAVGGKISRVWSKTEQQGPYWTSVAVRPAGAVDEVIVFQSFSPGGTEPDSIQATQLRWDAGKRMFQEVPAAGVKMLVAGSYATVEAARTALQKDPACLTAFSVVESQKTSLKTGRRFALAALTAADPIPNEQLDRVAACMAGTRPRVLEYK
ncbi:MAG: hypothetical protein H7039_21580 [Bryobacteraceae bacterium]|nr:hypothetical protein [Bryobacteraceae bacterium]